MLTMVRRVFFGPIVHKANEGLKDLSIREWCVMIPLILSIFVLGIKPGLVLDRIEPGVDHFLKEHAAIVHQTRNPGVEPQRFYMRASNQERAAQQLGARIYPELEASRAHEAHLAPLPKETITAARGPVGQKKGGHYAP